MTQIEMTSEISVSLVDSMGSDESVVHAARVSIVGAKAETEEGERKGLLNFLMKNSHSSPFEHVSATFMIECPIFVTREIHRHRTFSYNEVSGRYSILQPKFYGPVFDRPLHQVGKPGSYTFEQGSDEEVLMVWRELRQSYTQAWNGYQHMLENGIAKEVARDLLPVGIFTSFYMTGNLRNFLGFLKLRTAPDALYEIREVASQIERSLSDIAPVCMKLWNENGRGTL